MTVVGRSPTREVVEYVRSTTFEQVPSQVIDRLKLHLLDAIMAALYGSTQDWTDKITEVLSSWGGIEQSVVWFKDRRLPAGHAGFINTVSTHAFELDDRRVAAHLHPASATLPTALAISDMLGGVDGRRLITAIIVGYEVGLRVGKTVARGSHSRGFYAPGIGGAFAASATASHLLRLSADETAAAFNLTATQVSGLYSPTMIKRFNIGRGTYNGILAAELARAGFSGVDNIFEAEFGGFCRAYADDADLTLLTAGLGEEYETSKVELKPYVSSRPNHTSIDCILQLKRDHPAITSDGIESIEIEVSRANYDYGAEFEVTTVANALMSVAYCVCVAFLDGDAFLEQFTDDRISRGDVQELMGRTTVIPNEDFDRQGIEMRDLTRIRCRLRDGRTFEANRSFATGHPAYPLSEADVLSKAERLVGDRIPRSRLDTIIAAVMSMEEARNASDLSELLTAPTAGV